MFYYINMRIINFITLQNLILQNKTTNLKIIIKIAIRNYKQTFKKEKNLSDSTRIMYD